MATPTDRVRAAVLFAVLLTAPACRKEPVKPTHADVTVAPAAVDFGKLALGTSLPLTVEARNAGLAPAALSLAVEGPFALAESPSELGKATSLTLTITFTPVALGPATGTLRLGEGLPSVALHGEGLPACVASGPCLVPRFELTTRTCVEDPRPEGEACSAPCLSGDGVCAGGYCIGRATSCVDGDRCTIDACGSDGSCLHPPVECPITDPCQATWCDPQSGCAHRSLDDGTPCGASTCEAAHVCLGGQCQLRQRPNAALDCRYTLLSSGTDYTCAVTVGGGLRCWGANDLDQQGRGFPSAVAPPGLAPRLSGIRSVSADRYTTWISRSSGDVAQTNGSTVLPIDAAGLASGLSGQVCGLELGTLRCADTDAGTVSSFGMAIALAMNRDQLCVVRSRGEVECGRPGALAPVALPAPASAVSPAGTTGGCALVGEQGYCWGEVVDGGATTLVWGSGVTAIAGSRWVIPRQGTACAGSRWGVECVRSIIPLLPEVLPAPVVGLSLGFLHGCALLSDGRAACWGNNQSGQLGERTAQPEGPQLLASHASWLSRFDGRIVFEASSGGVWTPNSVSARMDDAGAMWMVSTPSRIAASAAAFATGCPCEAIDGGVVDGGVSDGGVSCARLGLPPGMPQACEAHADRVCGAWGGTVQCFLRGAGVQPASWDAGGEVVALVRGGLNSPTCALRRDGQVRCDADAGPAESLAGATELCLGGASGEAGCARLDGGALSCWGPWVQSPAPRTPAGAWPLVRQLACGLDHFCALAGLNIVQCWGDNALGQLGHDGPFSTQAVVVPMPEAVRSIAAGFSSTCALLQSGKVMCWGDNGLGELGAPLLWQSNAPRLVTQ